MKQPTLTAAEYRVLVGQAVKEAPKKPIQYEGDLQRAIIEWLKLKNPDAIYFHVPNSGVSRGSVIERVHFQRLGVVWGVSDLVFLWEGGSGGIELKYGKGQLTENERTFKTWCEKARVPYRVACSIGEVESILVEWGRLAPERS